MENLEKELNNSESVQKIWKVCGDMESPFSFPGEAKHCVFLCSPDVTEKADNFKVIFCIGNSAMAWCIVLLHGLNVSFCNGFWF